jgi:hypothetical protein
VAGLLRQLSACSGGRVGADNAEDRRHRQTRDEQQREHPPVEGYLMAARNLRSAQRDQKPGAPDRQQSTPQSASERQRQPFRDELPHES